AQGRVQRDASVHHFRNRLTGLRSFQLDAVLGRMTPADGGAHVYVGRLAVNDQDGRPLLVDWRSPVAEPFFAATRAQPMGLASRRRYRWAGGLIRDYWDETFTDPDGTDPAAPVDASPDEESALLATLNRARTPQMDSVLTTIAADQDAIIRADARRPLIVDGGRARARRWSPCTASPTCSTATHGCVTAAAACFSSAPTIPTCTTSPMCCPASARTMCAPAPSSTWWPRGRTRSPKPTPKSRDSSTAARWSERSISRSRSTRSRPPRTM